MRKLFLVLFLSLLVATFTGCVEILSWGSNKNNSPVITKNIQENKHVELFSNDGNYILLRSDRTCFIQHKNFYFKSYACKYLYEEPFIELQFSDGTAYRGKITQTGLRFGNEFFSTEKPVAPRKF